MVVCIVNEVSSLHMLVKSVCCLLPRFKDAPHVRPSVRPSVGWLVMLLSKTGKSMVLITNNHVSCIHIIVQSFHHEDAFLALWALLVAMWRLQKHVSVRLSISLYVGLSDGSYLMAL